MSEIIRKDINTVGELKEILNGVNDSLYFNFGTYKLGFEANAYGSDCLAFGLLSDDLEKYITETKTLNTYVIYYRIETEAVDRLEYQVDANSIEEALGVFFRENECLSYNDIIDHMEI